MARLKQTIVGVCNEMVFKQYVWQCSAFGSKIFICRRFCCVLWGPSSKRNVPKSTFINPREIINIETVSQSNQQFWRYIFRIILRSFFVRSSFGSRSVLDRFSFDSRSVLVHPSFILRSSFVHPPFILRSAIEDQSKNDRRNIGESSEARRRCIETLMGNQGKGDPNKNFFWPHYFLYAQYTTLPQANSRLHDAIDPT